MKSKSTGPHDGRRPLAGDLVMAAVLQDWTVTPSPKADYHCASDIDHGAESRRKQTGQREFHWNKASLLVLKATVAFHTDIAVILTKLVHRRSILPIVIFGCLSLYVL